MSVRVESGVQGQGWVDGSVGEVLPYKCEDVSSGFHNVGKPGVLDAVIPVLRLSVSPLCGDELSGAAARTLTAGEQLCWDLNRVARPQ